MSTVSMTTVSLYQNECIPEADLDAAFMAGKGAAIPPTCLPDDAPRTMDVLAEALGREATPGEWASYTYRWFKVNEPDRVLFFDPGPLPVAPVPLDASALFLTLAIAAMLIFARRETI